MSYIDEVLVDEVDDEIFEDDSPLGDDYLDSEDEEDKVPEGFNSVDDDE